MWETDAAVAHREFLTNYKQGDVYKNVDEGLYGRHKYLIYDGQQRLQTLYSCLKYTFNDRVLVFAAARSIDKEFRKDCIWIPIAGYAAATAIGIERVANKHHHWYDVVAGAGLGFGAAELTWWLSDLCFGKGSNVAVGSSGNTVDVVYNF